jgi:hypothetical protein
MASASRENVSTFDFGRQEEGDRGAGLGCRRDLGRNEVGRSMLE